MTTLPPTTDQERKAWELLASMGFNDKPEQLDKSFDKYTAKESKDFIRRLDTKLKEKLDDWEITVKDMIQLKSELFKQIQNVEGNGDTLDPRKLIPMNVTLNVQHNY